MWATRLDEHPDHDTEETGELWHIPSLREQPVVRFGAGRERDEEVDVALSVRFAAQRRAEQCQPNHTQRPYFALETGQALNPLSAILHWRLHGFGCRSMAHQPRCGRFGPSRGSRLE